MKDEQKSFESVTYQAAQCLKNRLSRVDTTLKHYHCLWRRIKRYMKAKRIELIDANVCQEYLLEEFGNRDYNTLSKREKDSIRAFNVLAEFIETGTIQPKKEVTELEGPMGQIMYNYLSFKASQRLAKHTIDEYEQHLYRFLCYLKDRGIISINNINQIHILNYIQSINPKTKSLAHIAIRTLRDFFKYIYSHRMLDVDFSYIMPKDNYKAQTKIPSIYTKEEVEKLIASIDINNELGKRDYAIILLAARLGLRASDIANLKFENILWEQNIIGLTQYKTGNKIELPLLSEVGNAIIDYLKYSRKKSDEPYVFLCARSPFNPIQSSVITQIVLNAFAKTEINTKHRRHGPHALRHSLAGRLLEQQTILPVISEVLGHESTESTKFYLRVDLTSMRQCALEVPEVSSSFYSQKGGIFYE